MKMNDFFETYHPFVNLIYFILVINFSMILIHPLAQGIALLSAILYAVRVDGKKSVFFLLKFCLPMLLLTIFMNPAFNHEGMTILLYFSNGNPLTLESILYGCSAGCMLITMLLWFSRFNKVMSSDKFIYLFGTAIPALSLIISMSLRFIPKFKMQMNMVIEAQKSIGRDISNGTLFHRTKIAILVISIMITWALENAIETADSMKSRGYGLKGRTSFSIYHFEDRDTYVLLWFFFCGLFLIAGTMKSVFGFRYFPNIRYVTLDNNTIPFYFVYFGLCITPVILNSKEERKWKTLYSKM